MKKIILFLTCLIVATAYGFSKDGDKEVTGIVFDKLSYDYGKIPFKGNGTTYFTLTNRTESPLIIKDCRASCGCTLPEWSKEPVKPGANTRIKVGYNTLLSGPFSKSITVITNQGQVTLTIKGEVAEKN